jgi:formate hydrogenlyase transcriptional activator
MAAIEDRDADLNLRRAEEALRASEQQLQSILDNSTAVVYVKDTAGRFLRVNRQFETLFKASRADLVGKTDHDLFPKHLADKFRSNDLAVLEAGGVLEFEEVAPHDDGLHTYISIKFPLCDSSGTPYAVGGISTDITERKQVEKALRESGAMLEKLFESSPDGIVATGGDGRIVRVNAQAEKLFGYRRDELLGQTVEILVPERLRGLHPARRQEYGGQPRMRPMGAGLELYARRKDGTEFPVDIMLSPLETDQGPMVLAVVRDITERKRAEEALRQSEEHFRLLVAGVKDYEIVMLDPQGRVTSWNSGAERIKGYRAEEIIGQHVSKFYTAEDVERGKPEHELKMAAAEGRFEDEGWRVRKDGSRFWANVIVTALKDEAGGLRGFAKVTRDFTERKRAEEALLLEITNVLVSNLDVRRLLSAISASIHKVVPHDFSSLALYDPATGKLRLQVLDSPFGKDMTSAELVLPLEGTPAGWAFTSRQPLVLQRLEPGRFSAKNIRDLTSQHVKSACWMPLVSRARVLGTLTVGSHREDAFTEKHLNLLSQVSNQVALAIDNAVTFRQIAELKDKLAEEKLYLEDELRTEYNFDEIIGESSGLKRILKQVETVATTDATVLILGETGTGKELIARAIHNLSARREHTFVKLNCAAIPSGLLESEIFGHEKGAFTGAIIQKLGRLELAHQGTLFLDEVGDIPLEIQPKLLRALQEKEFERLGSTRTIPVDVRLVAATNRDLAGMVEARQFRSDLYYRLKVFPITVPPLRERPEDIPLLVHYFAQRHAQRMSKRIETISPETMNALVRWHWPGNVRELENFLERAVILSRGPALQIPLGELKSPADAEPASSTTLEASEREHIIRTLRETRGVIAGPQGAAARLGLKRTTLNSKMRKLGITRDDLKLPATK